MLISKCRVAPPARLQKLVGEFLLILQGNLVGNLVGILAESLRIFQTHKYRPKSFGKFSEHFRKNFCESKELFLPTSFCKCATLRKGGLFPGITH